jgi:coenzyme F420-0:L-glutamate ligase / coenzyme F420-1:gamma-L-glutamate ligase
MTAAPRIELIGVEGLPLVAPGDDVADLIVAGLDRAELRPKADDIVVVAQKIISKAENRFVDLATIKPSDRARGIAAAVDKDPRLVEVILTESKRIVRQARNLLITEHRLGFVMANAGIDQSNVGPADGPERVLLLPRDPDQSAEALRHRLSGHYDCRLGVIINDSFGRAWRRGTVGVALGAAGIPALVDLRGCPDLFKRALRVSIVGLADELAAAASLVMGQAAEAVPVVLVRGGTWRQPSCPAGALIRPAPEDLFR